MWLQECCRQVKAEVVRYSRNKLNQTTFIWTYVYLVQHFDAPHSREVMAVTALIPPSSILLPERGPPLGLPADIVLIKMSRPNLHRCRLPLRPDLKASSSSSSVGGATLVYGLQNREGGNEKVSGGSLSLRKRKVCKC